MKIINYIVAATAMLGCTIAAEAADPLPYRYVSLGPVVAGTVQQTSLPKDAQKYLDKHFKEIPVASIEHEFLNQSYDVKLTNGIEIEFDETGHIIEIEAPDGSVLSEKVVKSVLPHRAVDTLKSKKQMTGVESIERTKRGYIVDINDRTDTELQFDKAGKLIAVLVD